MSMHRTTLLLLHSFSVAALLSLASTAAFSQALNSNSASVALTATLLDSLTVTATPAAVNFALVSGGVAVGSAPVVITTTWVLGVGRANVALDGYFASATQALTSVVASANIPSSAVFGQDALGTPTAFTAFTQATVLGTGSTGLSIYTVPLTTANRAYTRTDNLNLQIDLSAAALHQLPSSIYTGTLTLQAQAL